MALHPMFLPVILFSHTLYVTWGVVIMRCLVRSEVVDLGQHARVIDEQQVWLPSHDRP